MFYKNEMRLFFERLLIYENQTWLLKHLKQFLLKMELFSELKLKFPLFNIQRHQESLNRNNVLYLRGKNLVIDEGEYFLLFFPYFKLILKLKI